MLKIIRLLIILSIFVEGPLKAQDTPVDIKKALKACTNLTGEDDVKNRQMTQNILRELNSTCVVRKLPMDSVSLLNTQINQAIDAMDTNDVWNKANDIALEKSVKALWSTHLRLFSNGNALTKLEAMAMVEKKFPKMCSQVNENKIISNAFDSFQSNLKIAPVKFLSKEEEIQSLIGDLNPAIANINKSCKRAHDEYTKMTDFMRNKCWGEKQTSECNETQLRNMYNNYFEIEKITREKISLDMQSMFASPLGPLFITKAVRDKLGKLDGDFVFDTCMQSDVNPHLLNRISPKSFEAAKVEFNNLIYDEIGIISDNKKDDWRISKLWTLENYLRDNPGTIAELLSRYPDKETVWAFCSLMKGIHSKDWWKRTGQYTLAGVGTVTAIAAMFVTGGAATPLAIMAVGATVGGVTMSSYDIYSANKRTTSIKAAMATRQNELNYALDRIQILNETTSDGIWDIVITLATESFGAIANQMLKGAKLAKLSRQVATSTDEGAVLAKQLGKASEDLSNSIKSLGSNGKHLLHMTMLQEARLSEFITKLDPKSLKTFIKKVSELDLKELDTLLSSLEFNVSAIRKSNYSLPILDGLVDASKIPDQVSRSAMVAKVFNRTAHAINVATGVTSGVDITQHKKINDDTDIKKK